eukprot:2925894-Rhodomonas_salina.1
MCSGIVTGIVYPGYMYRTHKKGAAIGEQKLSKDIRTKQCYEHTQVWVPGHTCQIGRTGKVGILTRVVAPALIREEKVKSCPLAYKVQAISYSDFPTCARVAVRPPALITVNTRYTGLRYPGTSRVQLWRFHGTWNGLAANGELEGDKKKASPPPDHLHVFASEDSTAQSSDQ